MPNYMKTLSFLARQLDLFLEAEIRSSSNKLIKSSYGEILNANNIENTFEESTRLNLSRITTKF